MMPEKTILDLRSKAMILLQALYSLRISELRTVKMKNLIYDEGKWFIDVNPRNMEVKFAKQIPDNFKQANLLESKVLHVGIKSNTTIRRVFETAFTSAGFEYFRLHSSRYTMLRFAERQKHAFLNAIRQSLGHKSINTSFQSYGELLEFEQRDRIRNLSHSFDS